MTFCRERPFRILWYQNVNSNVWETSTIERKMPENIREEQEQAPTTLAAFCSKFVLKAELIMPWQ